MLSKIAALILGILSEGEKNPYEITKMLKEFNTKKWLPLADSSIYATINTLKKRGIITGRRDKPSNLPEKTIYSITPKGKSELQETIAGFIDNNDLSPTEFDIGILLMQQLGKKEVISKLKKKLEVLENKHYELKKQILTLERSRGIAFSSLSMMKHRLYMIEAEMKTIKEFNRELNIENNLRRLNPFDLRNA